MLGGVEAALGQHPVLEEALQLLVLLGCLDRVPGRRPALGGGRAGAVEDQGFGGDRARVRQRHALGLGRLDGVREAAAVVQGLGGLGVVALPEGLPDLGALLDAVLLLGGEQGQGRGDLAAPAVAEESADDGGQGYQVGECEGLDLTGVGDGVDMAGEHVLAGEVAAVLGLFAVGVDPVDIGLGVLHGQLAALAVGVPDALDLGLQIVLGVRRLRPELLLQALVGERAAGEGGQFATADVAEEVHQPEPVLARGVTRAVFGAVAGGALDVRDTGLLVTGDGDVVAGRGDLADLVGGHAEGGVVEERAEGVVGERLIAARQRAVRAELVGGVLGVGAEQLVAEDLRQGGVSGGAGRQDVAAPALAVVVGVRRRGGRGGGRCQERGTQGEQGSRGGGPEPSGTSSHSCSSVGPGS